MRPLDSGMLNSPDAYRTICTRYALTYPSSYNENGLRASFCGFRFLLHFISICLSAASVLFCTFHIRQGYLSPHNTAAKSEHFLYISSAPRI